MVAELDRSTTSFRRRAIAAGDLVLRGVGSSPRPGWPTGFRGVHWILQILGVLIFLVGTVFLYDMSQADGTGTGESQQIANVLQQILAEQQSQRARIDEMGQMIQGAAGFRASNFCIQTGVLFFFLCVSEKYREMAMDQYLIPFLGG